jgi:hypothetical protein
MSIFSIFALDCHSMRFKMRKILVFFVFASLLSLAACSSSVSFRVLDKQTNEDIKDYQIRVQGHGVDKKLEAGQNIKLRNASFSPPRYTADIEADGYIKNADYKLQRRFCFFCFKMFGTAEKQTVYMNRITSSINPESEETANQEQ